MYVDYIIYAKHKMKGKVLCAVLPDPVWCDQDRRAGNFILICINLFVLIIFLFQVFTFH